LVAKTLANLFLLLIGASVTGEVVLRLAWWIKLIIWGAVVGCGILAVIVMPDVTKAEGEEEEA
jgi:hypothetical protein